MKLEQAIFTSAKTDRAVGYQIIAHSPGIHQVDVRELAVWCPSHDSLLEEGNEACSINFHPLPSGAYCISRTVPAGWEYSGRGGMRVYTHCLIASPEALAHYSNNPFALLQSVLATGAMDIHDPLPTRLESLDLTGGAAQVDQSLLMSLSYSPGPRHMAVFAQSALNALCLAAGGERSTSELFEGLLNCFPPGCRLEFSFSTGLKFSGRRPFRLIALPKDPGQRRWMEHQNNMSPLDLSQPLPSIPIDGWARFIERVLAGGETAFLAAELSKRRFDLKLDDLPALGLQLLEDLESSSFSGDCPNFRVNENGTVPFKPIADPCAEDKPIQQTHAPHRKFEKTLLQSQSHSTQLAVDAPSACLHTDSPEVMQKLEMLDDLVYDAIGGRPGALDHLQTVWPEIRGELGEELLAESREQYLRYSLTIWDNCMENGNIRNPTIAVQALDVLCLLFEE
jgi:hypothetical protein